MNFQIENIGWTLGNDCPYRCTHCYSTIVRNKGKDLEISHIDRIVSQLSSIGVKTVNLGGNEPLFTNGPDPNKSLLPYIIQSLYEAGIVVGLTTSGITLKYLVEEYFSVFKLLNDIDISLDSPFAEEHNQNRGANLFSLALRALDYCVQYDKPHTIVMCGMQWNLSSSHLSELIKIAKSKNAFIRINYLKPTEPQHVSLLPTFDQFYLSSKMLLEEVRVVELGEPLIASMIGYHKKGCPCGTKSFRIHSITPDGKIPVSPCVYAHEFKYGDLLVDSLVDIINSKPFQEFRDRRSLLNVPEGCNGCKFLESCRGGCASRSYLVPQSQEGHLFNNKTDYSDVYCYRDITKPIPKITLKGSDTNHLLVHRDYLCTLIVNPN